MDFVILEARKFVSTRESHNFRIVKDYEIDMECGSGRTYTCAGVEGVRVGRGDVLFRRPGDVVISIGKQSTYILTLDFSGAVREKNSSRNFPGKIQRLSESKLLNLDPVIHPRRPEDLFRIYESLLSTSDQNSEVAKDLVRELIYLLNAESVRKHRESLCKERSVSENAIAYMIDHLSEPITLQELSSVFFLEKSYFARLFRSETGKTPIDMLIAMRLDKAMDLVATTDMSISEISAECGYRTVSFFIAAYKKRYRTTPEAHRRMLKSVQKSESKI